MNPKEPTLAELIADLNQQDPNQWLPPNNPTFSVNTIDTINLTGASTDTVTVGPASDTITLSDYNYSFPGSNVHGPYAYGAGINSTTWSSPLVQTQGDAVELNGSTADVRINGWSLVEAVKRIESRLNLLEVNPKLEADWAELQALGDQYRKLEQHILDKQATWDRLNAMPPPVID